MENVLQIAVPFIVGAAVGYFLFKKFNRCVCASSEKPDGIISVPEAINLHETYVEGRYPLINQSISSDFKDTQFVWFSYDKMKSYFQYLEAAMNKNPNNPKISGIRVYFGTYNEHPQYSQQQTVFFNPTVEVPLPSETYDNMKNLPFCIIPDNASEPLVGKYKVIEELLIDEHNPTERAFMANNSLGNENANNNEFVPKRSPNNQKNGGNNCTSLSFNEGNACPPPKK